MIRLMVMIIIILSVISCSHTPVVEQPTFQEPDTIPVETSAETILSRPVVKAEEPVAATPVAGAVQSMQVAEKKMLDTLKLVNSLQGDQILDCQENRLESMNQLQEFFGQHCFKFDRQSFWFEDRTGKKVGIFGTDGTLKRCKMGYFTSYKRLVSYQADSNILVEVEFYVDSTKGELMVHRYRNGVRASVESYVLAGF